MKRPCILTFISFACAGPSKEEPTPTDECRPIEAERSELDATPEAVDAFEQAVSAVPDGWVAVGRAPDGTDLGPVTLSWSSTGERWMSRPCLDDPGMSTWMIERDVSVRVAGCGLDATVAGVFGAEPGAADAAVRGFIEAEGSLDGAPNQLRLVAEVSQGSVASAALIVAASPSLMTARASALDEIVLDPADSETDGEVRCRLSAFEPAP